MLLGALEQSTAEANDLLAGVAAKVPVAVITGRPTSFAGKYTSTPPELRSRVVPLSGEELYLFADGTYAYAEWADIMPLTIFDRGRWKIEGGMLRLTSGPEITWRTRSERSYVVFRRLAVPTEVRLAGLQHGLAYFEDTACKDPEFTLLITSLARDLTFSPEESAEIKSELFEHAWSPAFFSTN